MPAIYIHIPFCKQKCKYCDFNSFAGFGAIHDTYIDALIREIETQAPLLAGNPVDTVFFGGGTPTLLKPEHISRITAALRSRFEIAGEAEISIEANPETITGDVLERLLNSGINRLSVGFQALDDELLQLIGRKHTAQQAVDAFYRARKAGFENINIDLISGLPGQTLAHWAVTLEQAASLEPEHLSCYSLTVEPRTPLEREIQCGLISVPDDDVQADMLLYTMDSLEESGFIHYEISNYAKPGKECRHNLVYWKYGDYLGLGAGAHSKIGNKRFRNIAEPNEYIQAVGSPVVQDHAALAATVSVVEEQTELSSTEMMSETMFLGLRLLSGVDLGEFEDHFGISVRDVYGPQVDELVEKGLVGLSDNTLKLTKKGLLLGNEVFARFV
ncbi:MAG TPA: radical SAM family heme chaperone HemW [Candidatus Aquicultor sp.]|jgi:oxygen-independent coproporphyrinogen-3 oxidase